MHLLRLSACSILRANAAFKAGSGNGLVRNRLKRGIEAQIYGLAGIERGAPAQQEALRLAASAVKRR
jgi:hypothetical protein